MKYCVSILILLLTSLTLLGQVIPKNPPVNDGRDRVTIVSSKSGQVKDQSILTNINPVYEHKGNQLRADSGKLYEDEIGRQFFEAFGNVVITQPSGTIIYADRLHYDAAMQHAILTNNVRLIDGNAILTTNYLTYNMRNKVGTYSGGGRIINSGDTITSKNAYYFELTKDAYFRNKVIVRTPDVVIHTDTMRYNSIEKITYFFGPTNINGRDGDKMYTELGNYNTELDIAKFSKNNLYTKGTKFLKGDSLYYERSKGYGEAFRNVVFIDTLDKFYANGGYGLYRESDQSILMTDKPLITYVVQSNDTTKNIVQQDSVDLVKEIKPLSKKEQKKLEKETENAPKNELTASADSTNNKLPDLKPEPKLDSVYMTADTLFSKVILVKDYKPLDLKLDKSGGALLTEQEVEYGDDDDDDNDEINLGIDSLNIDATAQDSLQLSTVDSLKNTVDSVVNKITAPKKIKNNKDSLEKPKADTKSKKTTNPSKNIVPLSIEQSIKSDSILREKAIMPTGGEADSLMSKAMTSVQKIDTSINKSITYSDTAKTRIVNAYHNVRLYKSDLQAVADSVYYGMVDSMFRFMGRPMIWSEGSQMSADTIFMQIKDQKMDNALLKDNAFMVNVVLDTVKFNQMKGRRITAFFADNNIETLFVDGNAENLVFTTNDSLRLINEMFHDRSSRFKIKMKDKKIIDYVSSNKVEQRIYPFKLVSQENEILPGFIWRPQDRPLSKEDLLNRKRELGQDVASDQKPTENPGKRTAQDEIVDRILENTKSASPTPAKK